MRQLFTALLALLALPALAQATFTIRGHVTDKTSGESLPGATVQVTGNGQNTGAGADAEGGFKIPNLPAGTYTLTASFVGYKSLVQTAHITTQSVIVSFGLAPDNASLDEVEVVATLAQERSTPVAFSAVNEVKLRETLSNRDLPMILNETPGVYATQGAGGGTGDSRITIRGFDQRNVATLVNGVPVNDMENGSVFWSNWDLGDVTKSLQVQRGISAAKITVPSIGGTINILTKGFDAKKGVLARLETGSNNYRKASLMLSSGEVKGGWAFTVYGARRTSDGWVSHAYDDAWTYFGSINKRLGKHNLSLTGMGSPQSHGQRYTYNQIGVYSNSKAAQLGANHVAGGDRGFDYNNDWGTLNRYTYDPNIFTIDPADPNHQKKIYTKQFQGAHDLNSAANYYHKPQINFNDFWQVNDKLFLSAVLYASFGSGGGVSGQTTTATPIGIKSSTGLGSITPDGQVNFQSIYDANIGNSLGQSTKFLANSVNNHHWYGFVLGGDYSITPRLTLSAGLDGRSYLGIHYQEVRDLLGGSFITNGGNLNADAKTQLHVGDKINFNYQGKTEWLGGYSQLEYKTPLLSAVISGTLTQIDYKRYDFFQAHVVTVGGKDVSVPYGAPTTVNGQSYTNDQGHNVETPWSRNTGYSIKGGINYNLTEHDNLFFNTGYNSKVPFFNYVYTTSGSKFQDVKNEKISSFELGYGITYPSMRATLNAYYTYWGNRNSSMSANDQTYGQSLYTYRNVNARHVGLELGVAQDIAKNLQLNLAISLGDWRWVGNGLLTISDLNNNVRQADIKVYLDGVHVGDAAQNQFQIGMRYEPFKRFYIRPAFLLFTKYYAGFNPTTLLSESSRTDSYRVPTSHNLDLHFGYDLPSMGHGLVRLGLKSSILNVFNQFYITDIPAGSVASAIDPKLLAGYFNRGRTFTIGLSATL